MSKLSIFNPHLLAFLICACAGGAAQADAARNTGTFATQNEEITSAGANIPAGAFGFLLIKKPREVTLLALRGIGGSGQVVLRTDEPGMCLTLPVRFVAGNFGGDTISGHLAEPIHFIIKNQELATALAGGQDIVSDEYRISHNIEPDADIVFQSGLDESFGFVINPGRNILGDIFGVRSSRVACQRV